MTRRVSYAVDEHTRVEFETDPVQGWREVGAEEVIARIGDAVAPLVAGATVVLDRLKAMSPNGIEIKFGIKVSGTANWVIAKAGSEGNFEVTLTWSPSDPPVGSDDVSAAG